MFCQSCGNEYAQETSYCKRCGASLNAPAVSVQQALAPASVTKPIILISVTLLLLTFGGFIAVIEGARDLSFAQVSRDASTAVVVLGLLTILISDIMLLRLLSRLVNATIGAAGSVKQLKADRSAPPPLQIPARPFVPASSVTEHTTRTLDPVLREPKA